MEMYGLYTVHKVETSADSFSYPVHSHTSHEILVVTKGRCGIVIGGTEYELGANDVAFMIENESHGLLINEAPFEFFAVQFVPKACKNAELDNVLADLCKSKSGAVLTVDSSIYPTVVSCMRRICDERSDTNAEMYFTYIKSILYELCNNAVLKDGIAFEHKGKKSGGTELLNAVIDYIGDNLNMISDLSFIESVFHYSNSHVNRLFRDALGTSVWQYITVKKLDLAYNLISEGCNIKTAASRCGFGDYSVFYKSFVKHFKISPSAVKSRSGPVSPTDAGEQSSTAF